MSTRLLVRASLYAAAYAALTLAPGLNSLAYGQVQFRVSEGLLAFACFDPAAVVGLTAGTALGNIGSSLGPVDVVFGTLLTLVAAVLMWRIGPRVVALAAPVVVNAFGVGLMLMAVQQVPFWLGFGGVALGETAVLFSVGLVLLLTIRRHGFVFDLPVRERGKRNGPSFRLRG